MPQQLFLRGFTTKVYELDSVQGLEFYGLSLRPWEIGGRTHVTNTDPWKMVMSDNVNYFICSHENAFICRYSM